MLTQRASPANGNRYEWGLLGAVKSEFGKYADALSRIKKLTAAQNTAEKAEVRTRAIHRKLRDVESTDSGGLIEHDPIEEDGVESEVLLGQPGRSRD
jgi:DNA anti-recombination protein RmuC